MCTNNLSHHDIDTQVKVKESSFPFPVLVASGTFGYGEEYKDLCDYNKLGAIVCKTVTKFPREGNIPPRIVETAHGSINSIGLANGGMEYFAQSILPLVPLYSCPYIVNVAAQSKEEFLELITYIVERDVCNSIWGWELNLSCPNVSAGTDFGKSASDIYDIVSHIKPHVECPIIVKLPPNVDDIRVLGRAAQEAGADIISACNTFLGMGIDIYKKTPILSKTMGGYSGEAIFHATLALVYQLSTVVDIPIIGVGGIGHANQAIQYLLAGASAVQVGTANFKNPRICNECNDGIVEYCKKQGLGAVSEICM